jgi:hypothetical protein
VPRALESKGESQAESKTEDAASGAGQ